MDRSKKGPPEVPHQEGALGDLWGTDSEGFWAAWRGGWRGTSEAYLWRGAVF